MRYLDFNTAELLKEATGEVSPCPLISHPNSDPHCDLRGGGGRGPAAENVVEPSHCACLQPALLFSSAVPQPGVVYEFEVQIQIDSKRMKTKHTYHIFHKLGSALFPPIIRRFIHDRRA